MSRLPLHDYLGPNTKKLWLQQQQQQQQSIIYNLSRLMYNIYFFVKKKIISFDSKITQPFINQIYSKMEPFIVMNFFFRFTLYNIIPVTIKLICL